MKFVVENENLLGSMVFESITSLLEAGAVFGLEGDLGAGKTTLVKQLAKKMNIKDTITSPTFNVVKRYPIPDRGIILQHLDLYRFDKMSKADSMEILEVLEDKKAISFVEWPERLPHLRSRLTRLIKIKPTGQQKREVEIVQPKN